MYTCIENIFVIMKEKKPSRRYVDCHIEITRSLIIIVVVRIK